jgi:glycosyltransferase involved in cell wall biosynthesis
VGAQPILFCSHVVEWGGAETVLADLIAALDRARFAPHLACPGAGPLPARASELGATVHELRIGGRSAWSKACSVPGAARSLRGIAQRIGARLLYANTMIAGYAAVLAQRSDLRCLWHLHVVTRSTVARFALRRAAAVITPSRAGARAVASDLAASDRLCVVPNGVAPGFFAAARAEPGLRAELGVAPTSPLVGIVGRIDPHKGHDVLLRAVARLPGTGTPCHVVVAGGEAFAGALPRIGGFTTTLQQLAARLGLAGRVHFLGHRNDLPKLLPALDVVAVPSTMPESAPRAIAEAQAAGCAVIASAIGGVAELVADGATGILVPPSDEASLAQALAVVLGDRVLRTRLGSAAREHAAANYSIETFARRIEAVCERVLATASG